VSWFSDELPFSPQILIPILCMKATLLGLLGYNSKSGGESMSYRKQAIAALDQGLLADPNNIQAIMGKACNLLRFDEIEMKRGKQERKNNKKIKLSN